MQATQLEGAWRENHENLVERTARAVAELQASGRRISFYAVAERAQIARSTLYRCPDLKAIVVTARDSPFACEHADADMTGLLQQIGSLKQEVAKLELRLNAERSLVETLEADKAASRPTVAYCATTLGMLEAA